MQVFRLSREKYALPLSGKGASIKGARWNSPGTEIIYTAENRSLAMAEVAVHFTWATLPSDYVMMTISIPDDTSISILPTDDLPINWNSFPHSSLTQKFGDDFIMEGKAALLRVPSVVTLGDFNILINPHHKAFQEIKVERIEKFPFDQRLF